MLGARVAALAIPLAACGGVLDPPRHHAPPADSGVPDDAGLDAGLDAAPEDAGVDAGCTTVRAVGDATADTILTSGVPDLNFDGQPIANVGVGISSVGLFRVDVSAVPAGADVRAARLVLSYVATSTACNAGCASCDSIDASGRLTLFYLRGDWTAGEATWNRASAAAPWGAPGAGLAGVDRSETPVASVAHVAHANETLEIDPEDLADLDARWRRGDEASFLLLPSEGAVFLVATMENAAEGCIPGGYPPARIEVEYCE